MKGQLNLFEPEFIKDIDCTVDTPVTRGNKDKPIYGTGKRIKPRVPGRRETKHMEEIYLEELLPLEEYDLIVVLISGGKDSIATYFKLRELGVPKSKIEFWHHDIDGGNPERHMDWRCTQSYMKALADAEGIPLRLSWRKSGSRQQENTQLTCKTDSSRAKLAKQRMEEKQMAQAMEKDRVIELLEYYKDIDGEVNIYRKIINDLTDQYYNPIGAIQCDGLPKGKNNISRQTENMALNIPDFVSGEIKDYEAKVQQLQSLKAQLLQEISRLKLKEKRIIFDFYIHNLKWEQVAVRNSYSERQCKNIRDNALATLSQRFEKNQIISQFKKIA